MDKLTMKTKSKVDSNIEAIGKLFPNAVTEVIKRGYDDKKEVERAIDFDILKQELSKVIVEGREERYQMNWPGKREAILKANTPINMTLRPCKEESVDFDRTENLYIEGDNLEVLKLLQETYLNKVKMIYIDPPYNTGNDFLVYNDDFKMSNDEFAIASDMYDEDGNINFDMRKNNESRGRFHTDWLNMMYPRLKLARDLLRDDGVIFISIDDNEVENMKKVCNEIFGDNNFIACFTRVTKKSGKSSVDVAKNNDYLICYSKTIDVKLYTFEHDDDGFKFVDEYLEKRGKFKLNQPLDYDTLGYVNSLDYPIKIEGNVYYPGNVTEKEYNYRKLNNPQDGFRWRWSQKLFEFGYKNGFIVIKTYENGRKRIYSKTYQKATISKNNIGTYFIEYEMRTKPLSTLEFIDNCYSNDNSKRDIECIFNTKVFDYSKPNKLLEKLCLFATRSGDIILDFFSGSATTAHAVMKLNSEDNGNRKFIMVQIPEETDEKSEAYKAGYKNVCEIGKERIRRAGKKIKKENPQCVDDLDTGFRVLKLASSNMKDVYYSPADYNQGFLGSLENNIKEDRSEEDLLFQVMLDLGVFLSSDIKEINIKGKRVFNVEDGDIIACFDKDIDNDIITEIAKMEPQYAVFRDSSLVNDSLVTNFDEIFKTFSPSTIRRIL